MLKYLLILSLVGGFVASNAHAFTSVQNSNGSTTFYCDVTDPRTGETTRQIVGTTSHRRSGGTVGEYEAYLDARSAAQAACAGMGGGLALGGPRTGGPKQAVGAANIRPAAGVVQQVQPVGPKSPKAQAHLKKPAKN